MIAATPIESLAASDLPFEQRALAWLREHHRIEGARSLRSTNGSTEVRTTLRERSGTSALDLVGLSVLSGSAAMSVLAQQAGVPELARHMLQSGVLGTLLAGIAVLAFAWILRTTELVPVVVQFHPATAVPIRAELIEQLRERAANREAWLVAEHGFSSAALQAATRLGVRCFHARGSDIEEVVRDELRRRERQGDAQ